MFGIMFGSTAVNLKTEHYFNWLNSVQDQSMNFYVAACEYVQNTGRKGQLVPRLRKLHEYNKGKNIYKTVQI